MSDFLRVRDVAQHLKRSPCRVYQLIRTGELPSCKVGGAILVPRLAWNEWMRAQSDVALAAAGLTESKDHAEAV